MNKKYIITYIVCVILIIASSFITYIITKSKYSATKCVTEEEKVEENNTNIEEQDNTQDILLITTAQTIYKVAEQQFIIDSMQGITKNCYSNEDYLDYDINENTYFITRLDDNGYIIDLNVYDTSTRKYATLGKTNSMVDIVIENNKNISLTEFKCS